MAPSEGWRVTKLLALIVFHWLVVIGNASSFLILPWVQPWYIALPLCSFIFTITFSREECRLTTLENKWRRELGLQEIKGFVKHYFIRPILCIKWSLRRDA